LTAIIARACNRLRPLQLCAVICGAESRDDIGVFGKSKLMFLRQYLPYESGIPSGGSFGPLIQRNSNACLWNGFRPGWVLKWPVKSWLLTVKPFVVATIAYNQRFIWCPLLPAKQALF